MAAVRPRPTRARKRARCSLHLSSSASSSSSQVEKPSLDQGSRPPSRQILQRRENQEAFGEGGEEVEGVFHTTAGPPSQARKQGGGHTAVRCTTHFQMTEVRRERKPKATTTTTSNKHRPMCGCRLIRLCLISDFSHRQERALPSKQTHLRIPRL